MKLSDERLKELVHWGTAEAMDHWSEPYEMARELLAARKVVEAAKAYNGYTRGLRLGNTDGPPIARRLNAALNAYDKATEGE